MTIDERIQALTINIETLHSNIHELWETVQKQAEESEKDRQITRQAIGELKEMNRELNDMSLRIANM